MRKLKAEDKYKNKLIIKYINNQRALKALIDYLKIDVCCNFDIRNLDLLERAEKKRKNMHRTLCEISM